MKTRDKINYKKAACLFLQRNISPFCLENVQILNYQTAKTKGVTTTMKALEESVLMDAFHVAEQNLNCYILFYNIAQPKMDRLKGLSLY